MSDSHPTPSWIVRHGSSGAVLMRLARDGRYWDVATFRPDTATDYAAVVANEFNRMGIS